MGVDQSPSHAEMGVPGRQVIAGPFPAAICSYDMLPETIYGRADRPEIAEAFLEHGAEKVLLGGGHAKCSDPLPPTWTPA